MLTLIQSLATGLLCVLVLAGFVVALLLLLGGFGLAGAQILSLSIYLHTVRVGIGLLGGIVFAFTRGSREAVAQTGAEIPRLRD